MKSGDDMGKPGSSGATAECLETVGMALSWVEGVFGRAALAEARQEALVMLSELLKIKTTEVYLKRSDPLGKSEAEKLQGWLRRRIKGEPSQYITGSSEFRGLRFMVDESVLIPRPETEVVVTEALGVLDTAEPMVLDLCTGSGCVAVSLAIELPGARVCATDASPAALKKAKANAEENDVAERVGFHEGDLFSALEGACLERSFDLIISNPPYVPTGDIKGLQKEVSEYEPRAALDGGADGLDFIRRIIEGAPGFLKPRGSLILEIGFGQAEDVKKLFAASEAFGEASVTKDLSGIDRVVTARIGSPSPCDCE